MKINDAVRTDIANSVLCWLASVDGDGVPNVTPKEIFAAYGDEHIVIADIASTNSVRNIVNHPMVCISFVDVFRQKGFKLIGKAEIVTTDDPAYQTLAKDLLAKAGPGFPIRAVIKVSIEKINRIWAPSYALFPERSEDERMQAAYATYGVSPLQ